MSLKHFDLVIPPGNPFANCQLKRRPYSEVLTKIVGSYPDGFVLAINNQWGTGKTTFVKMWEQALIANEFKTLYFNAWESDYESNPLAAIISELGNLKPKKIAFNKLLNKGAKISKTVLPELLKGIAANYVGDKVITNLIKDFTTSATEIFTEEVKEYAARKRSLKEFRDELYNYLNANNNGKPVVFIIDELDRCRPDYAVSILEVIKHFFSVPGITFVMSIDKIQLGHAIEGYYGSDKFDSNEYLRRFVDIEYSIPAPKTEDYCRYLYNYFKFDDFFISKARQNYHDVKADKEVFIKFSISLFESKKLTLRQQEKIFSHARLGLNLFYDGTSVFPGVYILLIYLKLHINDFYNKLKNREVRTQVIIQDLKIYISSSDETYRMNQTTLALLALFYHNYYTEIRYDYKLYQQSSDKEITYHDGGYTDDRDSIILSHIKTMQNSGQGYSFLKLDSLIRYADLIESKV